MNLTSRGVAQVLFLVLGHLGLGFLVPDVLRFAELNDGFRYVRGVAGGGGHVETRLLQIELDEFNRFWFVVHDQDFLFQRSQT